MESLGWEREQVDAGYDSLKHEHMLGLQKPKESHSIRVRRIGMQHCRPVSGVETLEHQYLQLIHGLGHAWHHVMRMHVGLILPCCRRLLADKASETIRHDCIATHTHY